METGGEGSKSALTAHYATDGLLSRIEGGLRAAGVDPLAPAAADLKGVDEFHIGGIEATEALLAPLSLTSETRVLDIGCGIGGTARHIAGRTGARVTGIDMTPDFVETARTLSDRVGLGASVTFLEGSALDLPLAVDCFDLATLIHVGMNIAEKRRLFAEVARILAPGGRFAVYDVMAEDGGAGICYPTPWAPDPALSFVSPPQAYRSAARAAGLATVHERDRSDYARDFFDKVTARMAAHGPPAVGLHLIMGDDARVRYANLARAVADGVVDPWEMIFEKSA